MLQRFKRFLSICSLLQQLLRLTHNRILFFDLLLDRAQVKWFCGFQLLWCKFLLAHAAPSPQFACALSHASLWRSALNSGSSDKSPVASGVSSSSFFSPSFIGASVALGSPAAASSAFSLVVVAGSLADAFAPAPGLTIEFEGGVSFFACSLLRQHLHHEWTLGCFSSQ